MMILRMGCIVVGIFAVIFLFYTSSFLMKRRKTELGLYNVLGLGKGHIAKVGDTPNCLFRLDFYKGKGAVEQSIAHVFEKGGGGVALKGFAFSAVLCPESNPQVYALRRLFKAEHMRQKH